MRAQVVFERQHGVYWRYVLDMLQGGQLRLVRTPGPGRRYRVVAGSLTIDEAVRSARVLQSTNPGVWFEYTPGSTYGRAKSWRGPRQQASNGDWFHMNFTWKTPRAP
jgi:hypothetical protein